jgi:hypothetical protein
MKRAALVFLLWAIAITALTLGGCESTPTSTLRDENARLQNIPLRTLTPQELIVENARLQTLSNEQLIAEKIHSQAPLTAEQEKAENARLQALTRRQLIVENTPPQALTREQLMAENARLRERLIDDKIRLSKENGDLSKDKNLLQTELRGAVRVPVTPQIVDQVRVYNKESELWGIAYYTSVPVSLRSAQNGGSDIKRESKPLQLDTEDKESPELTVLTYSEGGSSSSSLRIDKENTGALVNISSDGNIFDIRYQLNSTTNPLLLVFVLDPGKNWYELKYLGEDRVPLDVTGDRPYLMINYQTVFSGSGEARTQIIDRSAGETVYPEADYGSADWVNGDTPYVLVPAAPEPPPVREAIVEITGAYQTTAPSAGGDFFVVQIGAFKDKKRADAAYAALRQEGFNPHYDDYQDLTRVFIPAVESKDLARTWERVKALGFGEPYIRQ